MISAEDISERHKTANVSLPATKETARAIGRSTAALGGGEASLVDPVGYQGPATDSSSWMPRCRLLAFSVMLLTPHMGMLRKRASPPVLPHKQIGTGAVRGLSVEDLAA